MSKKNVEWEWKIFEECLDKINVPIKIPKNKYLEKGCYPIVSQEEELISGFCDNKEDLIIVNKPVVIFGDHTRNIKYIDFDFAVGADGVKILVPTENINSKFFYFFLKSVDIKNLGYARHYRLLKELMLPIPPLDEQERIVKVLDDAFEKIDAIKTTAETNLQNAKDLFQTTLANELSITDEKIKQGWSNSTLKDSCTKIVDGTHHSPINTTKGDYQYITAKNIRKDGIDLSNITYVAKDIHEEIYARCNPIKGDVLLIKDGATTGIAVINNLDYEFSLLSSVALLKTDSKRLNAQFLVFILNSDNLQKQMHGKMDGAAITRLTLVKIKELQIPLPPLPIQKQIVAKLDSLSEKVKQLESNYKQVLADCDELKKAILKKAFNGEL